MQFERKHRLTLWLWCFLFLVIVGAGLMLEANNCIDMFSPLRRRRRRILHASASQQD